MYKKDTDTLRTKNATLLTLIQALLNYEEEDAFDLVRQIRSCDNLEDVAQSILGQQNKPSLASDTPVASGDEADQFESELSGKMSELMLDGSRKLIGGTSNLIYLPPGSELNEFNPNANHQELGRGVDASVSHWTRVTDDEKLISHLMKMYFTWHYPFFTTLSRDLFYRDYVRGVSSQYCSSLLVNTMLALGCHFSSWEGAREDPGNSATAGDHFFKEAKRLFFENDEHANAKLCTVQALALMSVREAGCGRESKGWVYSGMSFRMASDLGLDFDSTSLGVRNLSEEEIDARRITFWGCFLFDKYVVSPSPQTLMRLTFSDAGPTTSAVSHSGLLGTLVFPCRKFSRTRTLHCGHRIRMLESLRTRLSLRGFEQLQYRYPSSARSMVTCLSFSTIPSLRTSFLLNKRSSRNSVRSTLDLKPGRKICPRSSGPKMDSFLRRFLCSELMMLVLWRMTGSLIALKHVLPAPSHTPLSPVPEVHQVHISASSACLASKALHSSSFRHL